MNCAVREWLAEIGTRGSKTGTFSASHHRPQRCEQPATMAVLDGQTPKQSLGSISFGDCASDTRNEPTSMKHFCPWLALSSAGTVSKRHCGG